VAAPGLFFIFNFPPPPSLVERNGDAGSDDQGVTIFP
jgi:hypothetical protein